MRLRAAFGGFDFNNPWEMQNTDRASFNSIRDVKNCGLIRHNLKI